MSPPVLAGSWESFLHPAVFVALSSLQGFPVTPAPTGGISSLRPDLMVVARVLFVAHATVPRRSALVAIAMGVAASNEGGGVSKARWRNGAMAIPWCGNGRRGDSNRLTPATWFQLHAIASPASNAHRLQ
jgi:hypothetical protein